MKILVISDTHIPLRARGIPPALNDFFRACDAVIHAGDFTTLDVLIELEAWGKPVYAVWGNMDEEALYRRLPQRMVAEVEGYRIGITHGSGAPVGIVDRVMTAFQDESVDILIFGHSHEARVEVRDGLLLLNPGSPTDTVYARRQTFAWMDLQPGRVVVEIRTLPTLDVWKTLEHEHSEKQRS